jgi:hypothetical protein
VSQTDNPEDRYAEILSRIEGRRKQEVNAPTQASLANILNGLNALGFLDDTRKKGVRPISIYGPKAVRGQFQVEQELKRQWAGAVAWYKPRGYHHYRVLNLLGIWAIEMQAGIQIVVGTKALEFDSPIFNPESYYRHIKSRFDLHYRGDGSPPPAEAHIYVVLHDPGERLAIREALQEILKTWAAGIIAAAGEET